MWGLGDRVQGSGFRVQGSGFRGVGPPRRLSRPESGPGFRVNVLRTLEVVPSSLNAKQLHARKTSIYFTEMCSLEPLQLFPLRSRAGGTARGGEAGYVRSPLHGPECGERHAVLREGLAAGFGFRVSGFGFRVGCLGFRV